MHGAAGRSHGPRRKARWLTRATATHGNRRSLTIGNWRWSDPAPTMPAILAERLTARRWSATVPRPDHQSFDSPSPGQNRAARDRQFSVASDAQQGIDINADTAVTRFCRERMDSPLPSRLAERKKEGGRFSGNAYASFPHQSMFAERQRRQIESSSSSGHWQRWQFPRFCVIWKASAFASMTSTSNWLRSSATAESGDGRAAAAMRVLSVGVSDESRGIFLLHLAQYTAVLQRRRVELRRHHALRRSFHAKARLAASRVFPGSPTRARTWDLRINSPSALALRGVPRR